ncbi:MAG: NAD(P)-binding domain-containing protein [Niabella sp.]
MKFGVVGNGSWATALVKILTENGNHVNWWVRNEGSRTYIAQRRHNPHYLSSVILNTSLLNICNSVREVVAASDVIVVAVPSAYAAGALSGLASEEWQGKKVLSAIKGILPDENLLLNEYLKEQFNIPLEDYFAVLGPCHAEEVAASKLSYLTFSGIDIPVVTQVAAAFKSPYINTVINHDIYGVQYAAVLKNIYALGAGIAHGLDYGDNFLSVYIANSADEMAMVLKSFGAQHIVVGEHENDNYTRARSSNYATSVYLGDLLVTCYSLYSRNRTFGNMIGKGYSVKAAQLEMNMVAEGYYASRCMHDINRRYQANMPIVESIYQILWGGLSPTLGFEEIEDILL